MQVLCLQPWRTVSPRARTTSILQDTPLRPERLLDVEAGAKARERWAGATLYNMQYTDQLVATGSSTTWATWFG